MTITSYAQNFEDVILWRVLRHVERGFYIDVGAQDPVVDSVSLAFYENGWRGVHIEPTARYASALREARPDEEVIEAAIGSSDGTISFFEFPDTGLSTGDEVIAASHEAKGHVINRINVSTLPLCNILDAHKEQEVHWLKIDVEGMEEQVIKSWHPSVVRPWVVLVESTKPKSTELSFESWHDDLEALGYEFVYFDGLNRFYVSNVHPELKSCFGLGPNVFDDFVLSGSASSQFCSRINAEKATLHEGMAKLAEELSSQSQALIRAREEAERAREDIASHQVALESAKRSWRDTEAKLRAEVAERDASLSAERAVVVPLKRSLIAEQALVGSLKKDLTAEQATTASLRSELDSVYRSTSWIITAPLRTFGHGLKWFARSMMNSMRLLTSLKVRRNPRVVAAAHPGRHAPYDEGTQSAFLEGATHQSSMSPPKPLSADSEPEGGAIMIGGATYDPQAAGNDAESVRRIYWQLRRARRHAAEQLRS